MAVDNAVCGREMMEGVQSTLSQMLVPQVVGAGCEEAGKVCVRDASRGSIPVDEGRGLGKAPGATLPLLSTENGC
jgi:hypothetical protein